MTLEENYIYAVCVYGAGARRINAIIDATQRSAGKNIQRPTMRRVRIKQRCKCKTDKKSGIGKVSAYLNQPGKCTGSENILKG